MPDLKPIHFDLANVDINIEPPVNLPNVANALLNNQPFPDNAFTDGAIPLGAIKASASGDIKLDKVKFAASGGFFAGMGVYRSANKLFDALKAEGLDEPMVSRLEFPDLATKNLYALRWGYNAEGSVSVQVLIDENGDVASAAAVSGHPLLRAAAEQAALQSKFKPTQLSGQPVKVAGVIVYNFVGENSSSWFKIGYNLMNVQHASSLIFLNANAIAKSFQPDWTSEKAQLERLAEIKQAEPNGFNAPVIAGERKISENTEKKPDGATVKTVVTERVYKSDGEPDAEQVAISQSLIASLQGRLGGGSELDFWQFNTGVNLSRALSKSRYTSERQSIFEALRRQIQSAPAGVSPEFLADLQKVSELLEKQKPTPEDRQQIGQTMSKILRN